MEPQVIIALVIAIPLILFPAAFVWYVNLGGVFNSIRAARAARRSARAVEKQRQGDTIR